MSAGPVLPSLTLYISIGSTGFNTAARGGRDPGASTSLSTSSLPAQATP